MSWLQDAEPVYHSGRGAGQRIALTFDDGPSEWTGDVLDALASAGARGTFFVMGSAIEGREAILRRLVDEGHELGNHLYSHRNSHDLDDEEVSREIARTTECLEKIGCGRPRLVRPPYGADCGRVSRLARAAGYGPVIMWSINPADWRSRAEEIVNSVVDEAHPGGIVLLHDGRAGGSVGKSGEQTVIAVPKLLAKLAAEGYEFVTVSEILQ